MKYWLKMYNSIQLTTTVVKETVQSSGGQQQLMLTKTVEDETVSSMLAVSGDNYHRITLGDNAPVLAALALKDEGKVKDYGFITLMLNGVLANSMPKKVSNEISVPAIGTSWEASGCCLAIGAKPNWIVSTTVRDCPSCDPARKGYYNVNQHGGNRGTNVFCNLADCQGSYASSEHQFGKYGRVRQIGLGWDPSDPATERQIFACLHAREVIKNDDTDLSQYSGQKGWEGEITRRRQPDCLVRADWT